jgi:hypothetical protein
MKVTNATAFHRAASSSPNVRSDALITRSLLPEIAIGARDVDGIRPQN